MSCPDCQNLFKPDEKAVELMHLFWDRERDEVFRFLEEYQTVCDFLAVEELETTGQEDIV